MGMPHNTLYLENKLQEVSKEPLHPWIFKVWGASSEALRLIESRIYKAHKQGIVGGGVYLGMAGIALMYFHLAGQWDAGKLLLY